MILFFFVPTFIVTHSTKYGEMGLHEELTTMSLESSAFPFVPHPEYPLTRNEWLKHYLAKAQASLKNTHTHTHKSNSTSTSQFKVKGIKKKMIVGRRRMEVVALEGASDATCFPPPPPPCPAGRQRAAFLVRLTFDEQDG